ncbi:Outer membrane efflux protein [Pseudobythopirellula maris]|uniref:Outer membrane efflux protein n=1 Tax=Pseudobythopirellula maris TaxID=2527991 RepID=A0A5C5ZKM5_9BACT|nr:TolC family protein [Pseudobythopirellula maris]TWT87351.1 Outer membrane efflux protein [Pseudobythopirellula maris]
MQLANENTAERPHTDSCARLLCAVLLLATLAGCSRSHYRRQADAEVNCIVDHKAAMVGCEPGHFRINIDPRSRMYDGDDPDRPPMPPDDPVGHTILQCVDGMKGAKEYRFADRTPFVENPDWRAYLPRDEDGVLVLDLAGAVDVALVHSVDFQEELEELYLSALDVTFERFVFDSQFYGGSSIDYFHAGPASGAGTGAAAAASDTGPSSSVLTVSPSAPGNRLRVEKMTATGGTIVAGVANSLIWQFSGPNNYTSNTLLDFAVFQPLLRGGGRDVVLETLTIAERAMVANVRAMERYRRGFYLDIATGRGAGEGPSRRGGFFGGSGLTGFTGVGGGGFGRVGGGGGSGGGGGGGTSGGAGAAGAGGYIGLLQTTQELANQRANVAALRDSVDQLEASNEAGRIDRFQVDLARQALFNAQSQLLTSEAGFQTSLDSFKTNLGLPPDLEMRLNDPLLNQFELRSVALTDLLVDVSGAAAVLRTLETPAPPTEAAERGLAAIEVVPPPPPTGPPGEGPVVPMPFDAEGIGVRPIEASPVEADTIYAESQELATAALAQAEAVEADYAALQGVLAERRAHLQTIALREEIDRAEIDPLVFDAGALDGRVAQLRRDMDTVGEILRRVVGRIEAATEEKNPAQLRPAMGDLSNVLLELSLLQARARLDAVDVEPTELTPEEALQIASIYRRDWKNARLALVDSWRLINFNANDLEAGLDVVFTGDIGNVGDNPFRLRNTRGSLGVGLAFDAPLTRLGERNVYRQSLIEYQQAKRDYYQFVDGVSQGLRATLRQVRLNEINLELRRQAVLVAIAQVDITQLRLDEPPRPGEETELSNTTARDLVQALGDLVNVQNDFLSVWVNNLLQQWNLEYDLGVMQIDRYGQRTPLGMPLRDFLHSPECLLPGLPKRDQGDIQLIRHDAPLAPAVRQAPPVPTAAAQHSTDSRRGHEVLPVIWPTEQPKRLPSTSAEARTAGAAGNTRG